MSFLKTLRKRVGLSVEEVAVKAGVSPIVIVQDENFFKRPGPDLEMRIAAVLGFPAQVIWPPDKPQAERVPLPIFIA